MFVVWRGGGLKGGLFPVYPKSGVGVSPFQERTWGLGALLGAVPKRAPGLRSFFL